MQAIYASLRDQGSTSEGQPSLMENSLESPPAASCILDQAPSGLAFSGRTAVPQVASAAHERQEAQQSTAHELPSPSRGNLGNSSLSSRDCSNPSSCHEGVLPSVETGELCCMQPSDMPSIRPRSSFLEGIQQGSGGNEVLPARHNSSHMAARPTLGSGAGEASAKEVCDEEKTGSVGVSGHRAKAAALTESLTEILAPVSPVSDTIPALHRVSGSDATIDHELLDSSADMSQTTIGGSKAGSEFEMSCTSMAAGPNSQEELAEWDTNVAKPSDAVPKPGFSVFPRFRLRSIAPTPASGTSNDVVLGMVLVDDLNISLDRLPRHVPMLQSSSGEVLQAHTLCASTSQDQVKSNARQAPCRVDSHVSAVDGQSPTPDEALGTTGLDVHGGAVLLQVMRQAHSHMYACSTVEKSKGCQV